MSASTLKTYNTFVAGVITEAGPMTFPENSMLAGENIVLNREGSIQRRLGMDLEGDYVLQPVTLTATDQLTSYRWENAGGSVDYQFGVVQAGDRLLIFDASADSMSANLKTTLDLSSYVTGSKAMDFASGSGRLQIATGESNPLLVEYNVAADTFSVSEIEMKVRDFWGLDDGLAVNEQPAALTTAHNYNLLNQGWPSGKIAAYKADTNPPSSVYPSNAQQWFLGRKDDLSFSPQQLKETEFGTSPAPKGHYIISPFTRSASRNTASGLTTATDTDASRPACVAFANQRVWFAGMESETPVDTETSPDLTGYVFYSRIIRNAKDFSQFHSDADPTSEIDSELIDSDGGYVIIPDAGKIHKLVAKGSSMLVLAESGIWEVLGDEGGFRATSLQVRKVSEFGCLGPSAVVDTEEVVMYWNRGGIYMLAMNESGFFLANNISENRIQTWYNSLNQSAKRSAVGIYDPVNRRVTWMYNDEELYTGQTYRNQYTAELVLDMALQAYYFNSISTNSEPSPYIAGYVSMPDFLLRKEGVRNRGESVTKYLVVQFLDTTTNSAAISFGYYRDEALRDWRSVDGAGTSYESYLITGYEIMGDIARNKQTSYVFVHCKRTELNAVVNGDGDVVPDNPSSLLMQARWDWSDSATSGKWGTPQKVYRLTRQYILEAGQPIDYGHDVIVTKNRVPGTGKALSIKFYSDGDNDFYLYGWAIQFTGRSNV